MKLKFSLFFIFYPLKCFKGKKCLSPVAITQPQDYHIWMTSLFDVVLSFNMFLVSFTVMGLPHWKRSVSIATTVMDDSSPKLLEHRKTELQERRKTYRFSQSTWTLVSVCVCVFVTLFVFVCQVDHLGSRDSQMHWCQNGGRSTARRSIWEWEEERFWAFSALRVSLNTHLYFCIHHTKTTQFGYL